jgi:hypothetical protein
MRGMAPAFVDDPDEVGRLCEVDKVGICPVEDLDDPGPPCLVNDLKPDDGLEDGPGSVDTEGGTGTLEDTTTVVGEELFVAATAYAHVLAIVLKCSVAGDDICGVPWP